MILHRVASGLVFLTGIALLRVAVMWESWPMLAAGLAVASFGLAWLVLGGSSPAPHKVPDMRAVTR